MDRTKNNDSFLKNWWIKIYSIAGGIEGIIHGNQVRGIMKMIGHNPTEAEVQDMVNIVDMDGTGAKILY